MRLCWLRFARWAPLLAALLVPMLAGARVGGGEHYKSGKSPARTGDHRGGGGDDLGGVLFYLIELTFAYPHIVGPMLLIGGVLFYWYRRSTNPFTTTQKAFE